MRQLTRYHGIVVGLGRIHLAHTLASDTLPIRYLAACDPDPAARSLFQDFLHIPHIFSSSHDLLQWVLSTTNIYVDCFIAHCPSSISARQQSQWFRTVASIIINCLRHHGLQLFCVLTPSKLEGVHIPSSFQDTLQQDLWITSTTSLPFPSFGDSIDDNATAILGVTPPSAYQLAASIIKSTSRLFFIFWQLPSVTRREWHLVCVDLPSYLSLNPDCLTDGRCLFATINGRNTHDRVSLSDWDILSQSSQRYDDDPPDLNHRDFTGIQFSRSFHRVLSDPTVRDRVLAMHFLLPELPFPIPHCL
ncbi:hypothetical protein HJC23_012748 [Cyclotella cryptica]|uniref:Uncharacterized protein n=1 Tax=Cyclotella cryptica TaxID=29204 RepID=A0ABD3P4I0_9STRA